MYTEAYTRTVLYVGVPGIRYGVGIPVYTVYTWYCTNILEPSRLTVTAGDIVHMRTVWP